MAKAYVCASLAAASWLAGCGEPQFLQDPLERSEIAALGPESPTVPAGPLHRPGQPCAVCHRDGGTATAYSAAGTVFRDPLSTVPVADVAVVFTDSAGQRFSTKTNCVGNFYLRPSELTPVFPMWVFVQFGPFPWTMDSPIHREASCAACHFDPAGPASAGHVFLTDDVTSLISDPVRACTPEDGTSR
jgi:hypothetical protein